MLDVNAIKAKLEKLQNNRNTKKQSSNWRWKPELGDNKIRVLPWKDEDPSNPVKELYFYYGIDDKTFLCPAQFGKPDPIEEFRKELLKDRGNKESWLLSKKLEPKIRGFLPVIVRGKENEGVKLWSFGVGVYQRMLELLMDPDIGDYKNIAEGRDLKVKSFQRENKKYPETQVDPSLQQSQALGDTRKLKELLESVPNPMDFYELKPYDEMKKALDDWLNPEESEDMKMPFDEEEVSPEKILSGEENKSSSSDLSDEFNSIDTLLESTQT